MSHISPELLSAFLDGALDPRRARRVRAHLAACVHCAKELEALRAVDRLLKDQPAPRLPAADERVFAAQVTARIRERAAAGTPVRARPRPAWWSLPRLLPWAGTAVAAALVAVVVVHFHPWSTRGVPRTETLTEAPPPATAAAPRTVAPAAEAPSHRGTPRHAVPAGEAREEQPAVLAYERAVQAERAPTPVGGTAGAGSGSEGIAATPAAKAAPPELATAYARSDYERARAAADLAALRDTGSFDPLLLAAVKPLYRPEDLTQRKRVELRVLIDSTGQITQVIIIRSSGDSVLDHSARNAVSLYRYEPARRAGRPIPAWVLVPVDFTPR